MYSQREQEDCVTSCQDLLDISNDPKFLNKIVTGHEYWCFVSDPKSKWQSATCVSPTLPKVKKLRF